MTKWKPAPTQILIALNAMLLFFVLLEDHLSIPRWLQVAGRLHPVILHFPIVLIVAYTIYLWFRPSPFAGKLLLWSAFAAVITALAGVFLSKEGSYEGSAIQWHKWLGTLTALILLLLYLSKDKAMMSVTRQKWLATLPLIAVLAAGHFGGDVTHGAGYVLAPLKPLNSPSPPLDQALVYRDVVYPVLNARCMECHNSANSKGLLNMEDSLRFAVGGRNGKPWDTTAEGLGLLINRIHLPADDNKHMPPADKTQLTPREAAILYAWIRDGAPFGKKVIELDPNDTLRMIAARLLKSNVEEVYDFPAADDKRVAALNTNYRAITRLANGSPALAVDFYGKNFFESKQLQELSPIKNQIVSLNLDKMPVTDKDLSTIVLFQNLRRLNLDFTRVTGAGLSTLTGLPHLQSLSLSGTQIKAADLDRLAGMATLHKLYLWKTDIPANAVDKLRRDRKDLQLITGFNADTVRIKLNPPRLETEARIIRDTGLTIRMHHFIPGATIRYTLDGANPDSSGQVYTAPFPLNVRSQFIAKAYKPGWLPSDPTTATFYTQRYPPDSIRLLLPVDSNYLKFSPHVLIDADKGDLGYGSGKWLGFRKNGLSALLYYRKPVMIRELTFSSLVDIGSFIFPPTRLEVWGGPDEHHLKRLGTLTPAQPDSIAGRKATSYLTDYRIEFPSQSVRCLKVIANPVAKLPNWHPGKGTPGWIFFDELLVN
jgi:uncharacterized membrane protein